MVKENKLFSPQAYLELVTGHCYIIHDGDVAEIERILNLYGLNLWSFPLNEIDHIVENDLCVVLVECVGSDAPYIQELRWFEVPREEM